MTPGGRVHYSGGVLRASFWLTGLLFVPLGLLLYLMPPTLAAVAGFAPLWLVRAAGGLLLAWGGYQIAASFRPDLIKVGGLLGGNLLVLATLLPAWLRLSPGWTGSFRAVVLAVLVWLGTASLLALLTVPLPGRRPRRASGR